MYFLLDGTTQCGFYECKECDYRFLDARIAPVLMCPMCGKTPDMEIGPDEEMPKNVETAKLLEMVEGEENVARYDQLLSVALTGGDPDDWI